ncbi:hypothetical protein D3C87_1678640 [compost metagenome]
MFCLRSFGLHQLVALSFGVEALREYFSGFNRFSASLRQRNLWIRAERHVDSILGNRMPVVEIPLHRAIDPDSQLKPVTIGEDVVLVFGFDSLELTVREAGSLSAHEKYSMSPFGIPKISAG